MVKGRYIPYTEAELAWAEAHATWPRRKAHAWFCRKFGRTDVDYTNFKSLCTRNGWATGRDGRIPKGNVPYNKGMKMGDRPGCVPTQFKKGDRTGRAHLLYKPIGTERVTRDGYIERKINDDMPLQKRWRAVHLINWEAINGPLPAGHCLKCLDGNKANTQPSNWDCLSRGEMQMLNSRWRKYDYDQLDPEVKAAALAAAKLKYRAGTKRKGER